MKFFVVAIFSIVLMNTFVVSLTPPKLNRSELIKYISADTKIADSILRDYDKRFIPTISDPLTVQLQVVIEDILKVANMEAEMIIFLRQTWYDYRLSWNGTKRIKVREHFLDKIWIPDVRITNLKEIKQFPGLGGVNMNIHPNGRVYLSKLIHIRINCPMDLQRFPIDWQTCFINFKSYAYDNSKLNFTTSPKKVEVRHHRLSQFEYVGSKKILKNKGISKLTVFLKFRRRVGHYILQGFLPATFLVVLSWLAFLIKSSNITDRLTLEITIILSTVVLLDNNNDKIVQVSYVKALDLFIIVCFGFIFLALLETMLVYRLWILAQRKSTKTSDVVASSLDKKLKPHNKKPPRVDEKEITVKNFSDPLQISFCLMDKISLVLFPLVFIGFNIGYWYHFLS